VKPSGMAASRIVATLFFASGLTSLAYEIVWVRALGLLVGNSLWAAVAVVAAYMGGMAGGAALVARVARHLRAPLRWYAVAEALTAVVALATPAALQALAPVAARLGPEPLTGWGAPLAARFLLAWGFLAVPTVAMGTTLPLVVERLRGTAALADRVARLYAANTAGAVAGVLVAAFGLLPTIGERATLSVAASLGLTVAALAWFAEPRLAQPSPPERVPRPTPGPWLVVPTTLGFVALAAELVWTRILILHLGSRVYAFALILAVYLVGLTLGSALARRLTGDPTRALAGVEAVAAIVLAVQIEVFVHLDGLLGRLAAVLRPSGFVGLEVTLAIAVALALLPATITFGAAFPLTVAACRGGGGDAARTGRVAAANTLGGIVGALFGPIVLVPMLGTQAVVIALAAVCLVVSLWLAPSRWRPMAGLAGIPLVLVALFVPAGAIVRAAAVERGGTVEAIRESATATVVVRRVDDARGRWRSLELNGVNVAGTSPELRAIQRVQGHLPLLLHPGPRSVLHVGFGSGSTAWAVSRHAVKRIVIAEISPEVLALSGSVFADVNHGILGDPRVSVVVNDGRNVLLATRERFDIILSDSIHPVYAGNSTLYTREYFALCRDHLTPGGVVSMWLPLYSLSVDSYLSILRAFREVFPQTCVWYDPSVLNEFTVVTGRDVSGPVRLRWGRLADPALTPTLAEAGVRTPSDLAGMLLLGPSEVAALTRDVEPHVDDFPEVEYRSGRLLDREGSWLANFAVLVMARARRSPFAAPPCDVAAAFSRRDWTLAEQLRALQRRAASR
jgi:spermidine synthase